MMQHAARGRLARVLFAGLWVAACESSDPQTPPGSAGSSGAGEGGTGALLRDAGTGGASDAGAAGASGAGGSSGRGGTLASGARPDPATASELEACLYYYRTTCNRRFFECEGNPAVAQPCPFVDYRCPDALFAPGSPFTIRAIIECGDVWAAASCDALNANDYPVCGLPVPPREAGQPCIASSQCASRACADIPHPALPECGQCASVVGLDETCNGVPQVCDDGLECTGSGCKVELEFGLPEGAACERFGQCAPGLRCQRFADQVATTCQALPALGESCASDVRACQSGSYCGTDDRCQPAVGLGAACGSGVTCQAQFFCDRAADEPTCVVRQQPGEACLPGGLSYDPSNCADGSLCQCDNRQCTSGTCVIRRDPGEVCGEPNVVCIPGTECQAGRCAILRDQNLPDPCPEQ